MCGSNGLIPDFGSDWDKPRTWLDPAGLTRSQPDDPTPIPPPKPATKGADKIYGAGNSSMLLEKDLTGTSSLQIPMKTIQ